MVRRELEEEKGRCWEIRRRLVCRSLGYERWWFGLGENGDRKKKVDLGYILEVELIEVGYELFVMGKILYFDGRVR